MIDLYDILEVCLNEIEQGAEIDSVLSRYPEHADELSPLLHASVNARAMSVPEPSPEVLRRNRAKILQHAAEMREGIAQPRLPFKWAYPLRRLAASLAILMLAFASGTSLVGAASTSLPGDNLYGVKRSWEGLQLVFSFNAETREALEVDHENERIEELLRLFAGKRSAEVEFNGVVTQQGGGEWQVAGIRVVILPETNLPEGQVPLNAPVRVEGQTQPDGSVVATHIELLAPGASLPEVEEAEDQRDNHGDDSKSESGSDAPATISTQTPKPDDIKFNGVLNVSNGDFWMINGVPSDVSNAEVEGTPVVGAAVTVEGYFDPDGTFIVTKIKFEEEKPDGGSSGSNSNNNNDNSNSNDHSNDNDNDDDNSGSGGGDD